MSNADTVCSPNDKKFKDLRKSSVVKNIDKPDKNHLSKVGFDPKLFGLIEFSPTSWTDSISRTTSTGHGFTYTYCILFSIAEKLFEIILATDSIKNF